MKFSCFILIFISVVVVVNGWLTKNDGEFSRLRRQLSGKPPTFEDCMDAPRKMKKNVRECCKIPKEKIFGNLKTSLDKCFDTLKNQKPIRQEMDEGEMTTSMPEDMVPATEPSITEPMTDQPPMTGGKEPEGRRRGHHFRNRPKDGCFMECVFQDQGFLVDKKINKEAILERIRMNLADNTEWYNVAATAVETCSQTDLKIPSNKTCVSGAEETFRCVFKEIFFNCPTLPHRNQYCTTLKEFYQRCDNSSSPEMNEKTPEEAVEEKPEGDPEKLTVEQ